MSRPNPYAVLLDPADETEEVPGWVRRGIFLVNKATGEKKLSPKFKGGEPGLGKEEAPGVGEAVAERLGTALGKAGATPGQLYGAAREGIRQVRKKASDFVGDIAAANRIAFGDPVVTPPRVPPKDPLPGIASRMIAAQDAAAKDKLSAALTARGVSPAGIALADTGVEGAAVVADPSNFLPGAAAIKAGRALTRKAGSEALETVGQRAVKAALWEGDNAALRAVRTPETGIGLDDLLRPAEPDPALVARFPDAAIDARSVYEDALIPPAQTGLPPVEIRPGGVDVRSYDLSTGRFKLEGGTDEFTRRAADAGSDRGLLGREPLEGRAISGGEIPSPEPALAAARSGEAGFISIAPLSGVRRWIVENFSGGGPAQGKFNVAAEALDDPAQAGFVRAIPKRIEAMEGQHARTLQAKTFLVNDLEEVVKEIAPSRAGRKALYKEMHKAAVGDIPVTSLPAKVQRFVTDSSDLIDQLQQKGIQSGALPSQIVSGGPYRHRAYRAFEDDRWIEKVQDTPDWFAAKSWLTQELGSVKRATRSILPDGREGVVEHFGLSQGRAERMAVTNNPQHQAAFAAHWSAWRQGQISRQQLFSLRRALVADEAQRLIKQHADDALVRLDDGTQVFVPKTDLRPARQVSEDEVLGIMMTLADREHGPRALSLVSQGAPTRINSILKKRQNIPEPLRKLMGEYDDFRISFEKTVQNLSWDIETHNFWKELGDDGLAAGVFRTPDQGPTEQLYRALPGSDSVSGFTTRSPVEGYLTSDGIKKALLAQFEVTKTTAWQKAAGWTKSMKTVYSIQGHGRNTISHSIAMSANGHAPAIAVKLPRYVDAWKSRATRLRAVELGIVDDGALSKEAADYLKWMEGPDNVLSNSARRLGELAQRAYKLEDDVPKFLQWMAETDDRVWAGMSRPEAEKAAADIIRDTTQSYSRSNQMAGRLSRNPLFGSPGVRFTFESARNLKNIARQGARDIREGVKTGNQRLVALGVKRLGSLTAAAVAGASLARYIRQESGMSAEQEESFRRLAAPPYAKNAQLVFGTLPWQPKTFIPGEKITYFDRSFIDPYSGVLEPLVAAQRSIQEGAPAADVAWEVLNGIAGGDVLAETAFEVGFGRRLNTVWPPEIGGALWQKTDAPKTKVQEAAYRLYQGTAPGTVVTAERILRGAGILPQTTRSGRQYNLADEMTAIAGPRFTTVEIPTAYRRGMGEVGGLARDARTSLRGDTRLSGPEAAAARYLGNWQAIYEAARERIEDGRNLGLSEEQLISLAREAGTPPAMIGFALQGRKEPPPPTMRPDDPEELAAVRAVFDLYRQRFGQASNPYAGLVP